MQKKPYAWSLPYLVGHRTAGDLITLKFCRGFHWNYKIEQIDKGECYFFAYKNVGISTPMFDSRSWDFLRELYPTAMRVRENILRIDDADLVMMKMQMR